MTEVESTSKKKKKKHTDDSFGSSVAKNMIAGGAARSASAIILHPIDLVKTRMQFQSRNLVSRLTALPIDTEANYAQNHGVYYRNGAHAIWHTLTTEGPFALYRGLVIRLLYVVPSAAVNFTVYDQFRRSLVGQGSWNHVALSVLLGVGARMVQTGIRTPFDVVKQQLQVQGMASSKVKAKPINLGNTLHTVTSIAPSGFWSGYPVTLLRDFGFGSLYFGSYEEFYVYGVSGALAGAFSTVLTIPFDVVKTRLQTQAQLVAGERRYTSSMDVVRYIRKHEDYRSFFRGVGPRIVQTMPAAAITFVTYEFVRARLEKYPLLDRLDAALRASNEGRGNSTSD